MKNPVPTQHDNPGRDGECIGKEVGGCMLHLATFEMLVGLWHWTNSLLNIFHETGVGCKQPGMILLISRQ